MGEEFNNYGETLYAHGEIVGNERGVEFLTRARHSFNEE